MSIITYSANIKPDSFLNVKDLIKRYRLSNIKFYNSDDKLAIEVIRSTHAKVPKKEIDILIGSIKKYMSDNALECMCFDNDNGFIDITESTESLITPLMPPINCLSAAAFKRFISCLI